MINRQEHEQNINIFCFGQRRRGHALEDMDIIPGTYATFKEVLSDKTFLGKITLSDESYMLVVWQGPIALPILGMVEVIIPTQEGKFHLLLSTREHVGSNTSFDITFKIPLEEDYTCP